MKIISKLKKRTRDLFIKFRYKFIVWFRSSKDETYTYSFKDHSLDIIHVFGTWSRQKLRHYYNLQHPHYVYLPNASHEWNSELATGVDGEGLKLGVFSQSYDSPAGEIKIACGLICSDFNTSYGIYEFNFNLPLNKYLKPTIRLESVDGDFGITAIYAKSGHSGDYSGGVSFGYYIGAAQYTSPLSVDVKRESSVRVEWYPNVIKIWHNHVLACVIDDIEILSRLNLNPWCKIVAKNSIDPFMLSSITDDYGRSIAKDFVIKSIIYSKPIV